MSVINKMLRDLDQRSASTLDPALRPGTRLAARPAEQVTPTPTTTFTSRHSRAVLWGGGLLALAAVATVGGFAVGWLPPSSARQVAEPKSAVAAPATPAMPATAPVAAPPDMPATAAPVQALASAQPATQAVAPQAAAVTAAATAPAPAGSAAGRPPIAEAATSVAPAPTPTVIPPPKVAVAAAPSGDKPMATVLPNRQVAATTVSVPSANPPAMPTATASSITLTKTTVATSATPAPYSAATPPAPPTPPNTNATASPDPAVIAQRQQAATREVLAQAQSLFHGGSAEAAILLLQDSLHTAERATPPAPATTQLQLVRELVRMELAQGKAPAVLELLSRLEPLITGQADLWAVRANAAQRLGRHHEAVQFYSVALQSRPAEPRWLLGSAVSQAALGQLAAAAELANKARAAGPVSNEVLTYLRQQGVALADRP